MVCGRHFIGWNCHPTSPGSWRRSSGPRSCHRVLQPVPAFFHLLLNCRVLVQPTQDKSAYEAPVFSRHFTVCWHLYLTLSSLQVPFFWRSCSHHCPYELMICPAVVTSWLYPGDMDIPAVLAADNDVVKVSVLWTWVCAWCLQLVALMKADVRYDKIILCSFCEEENLIRIRFLRAFVANRAAPLFCVSSNPGMEITLEEDLVHLRDVW